MTHSQTDTEQQAQTWYQQARQHTKQGQLQAALQAYQQVLKLLPGNLDALLGAAEIQQTLGQPKANLAICEQILPHPVPDAYRVRVLLMKALAQENLQQMEAATETVEQALALAPDNLSVIAHMAGLMEKRGQLELAQQCVSRGLAIDPQHVSLRLIKARCLRRAGELEQAIALLSGIRLSGLAARHVHYELGRCYDKAGEVDQAWPHFKQANDITLSGTSARTGEQNAFVQYIRHQLAHWTVDSCSALGQAEPMAQSPIQLFGFPRTGSTMVDQVLDAHSALQSLEEAPLLNAGLQALTPEQRQTYPQGIPRWSNAQWERMREGYLQQAQNLLLSPLQPHQRIVDKNPLNSAHSLLLARMFPGAPFIFLIRHPMAACLSCFQQDFARNEPLSNSYRMDDITLLFDLCMQSMERAQEITGYQAYRLRYEDLVADFDQHTAGLMRFLGLEPEHQQKHFHEHAGKKKEVGTASYHQVTQKLYDTSVNKWRAYERYLMPWAERLRPWCERFGYDL